jgi:peptidoglycan L-alanyl-D-glutamate endopeptidase CwlK
MSKFILSTASKRNISGVSDNLKAVANRAIQITNVDFGYWEDGGLRTAERQNQLHLSGASPRCDGYEVRSVHQDGLAIDFYAYVNGRASWAEEHLAMVAAAHLQAASELGVVLEWGGLWKPKPGKFYGWDMPHIQEVIK